MGLKLTFEAQNYEDDFFCFNLQEMWFYENVSWLYTILDLKK